MSTIDAQCLLAHLITTDPRAELPGHWCHRHDGRLTWRFGGSDNDYTWDAAAVEQAAAGWREVGADRPTSVAAAIAAHERLLELTRANGRPAPDAVLHDLDAGEVSAVWNDEKLAVVVEHVGEASAGASPRS